MHITVEEVRRYVVHGVAEERAEILDYCSDKKAKVVREDRKEQVVGSEGIVVYAERMLQTRTGRRC